MDFNLLHLSLLKRFPSFFLASVCRSLQFLISALTRVGGGDLLFRFACSVVLRGGRGHCRKMSLACVGSTGNVPATLGLPLLPACVFSPSTLLRLQAALQGAGPELHALPRPKLLRFRFSGTPQRRRLCWACVWFGPRLSSSGSQELAEHTLWVRCTLSSPRSQPQSGVPCVSSGKLISGCKPPGRCQPSRISGSLWLETGGLFAVW